MYQSMKASVHKVNRQLVKFMPSAQLVYTLEDLVENCKNVLLIPGFEVEDSQIT